MASQLCKLLHVPRHLCQKLHKCIILLACVGAFVHVLWERYVDCRLHKPCGTPADQCPHEPHLLTICGFCSCSSSLTGLFASSVWHFSSCPTECLPYCVPATPGCCHLHGVRGPPQMIFPTFPIFPPLDTSVSSNTLPPFI